MGESDYLHSDDMQEIVAEFLAEADDLTALLNEKLLRLEQTPDDQGLLDGIFRAAHTLKGSSGFLGLEDVRVLTHRMEDILNQLRRGQLTVNADIMDALLKGLDTLTDLIGDLRQGDTGKRDLESVMTALQAVMSDDYSNDGGIEGAPIPALNSAKLSKPNTTEHTENARDNVRGSDRDETDRAETDRASNHSRTSESTLRVDVDRLDSLMNLMGELVLSRNSLIRSVGRDGDETSELSWDRTRRSAATVDSITTEMQTAVMSMRMQPVSKIFNRFPRIVRDLARDLGKKISLVTRGAETEIDKSVVELLVDPLVHIIRNACDHGLEAPDERIALGKPEEGRISLTAAQEGSFIVLRVTDDGRGLDVESIRRKAVDRGILSAQEARQKTDRELTSLVFAPGFSTAASVTDLSGRGVGMDVVRHAVERVNGQIELSTTPGSGTVIHIRVPLTLAIVQGLLVLSGSSVFVLPLSSVLETVKMADSEINLVDHRRVLRLRDRVVPIVGIEQALNRQQTVGDKSQPYIVVLGLGDKRLGVAIDAFRGQEEVVVKPLGKLMGTIEGVAGATILGDGRVRLIVDVSGLFGLAERCLKSAV